MSTAEDIPLKECAHRTELRSKACANAGRRLPRMATSSAESAGPITEEEILRACETVSLIIETYGDVYWPILDRLEGMLEKLKSRRDRLSKYNTSGKKIKRKR